MNVFDNVLDRYIFFHFSQKILDSRFPWFYGRTAHGNKDTELYRRAWVHNLMGNSDWSTDESSWYEMIVMSLLYSVEENVQELLRVRLVLNTATDKSYVFGPHVDFEDTHKTALFYINDSDGDTIIYNERFGEIPEHLPSINLEDTLTVAHRIKPESNRLVIFDGLHYHSGSTPCTTDRRVVMNINYI